MNKRVKKTKVNDKNSPPFIIHNEATLEMFYRQWRMIGEKMKWFDGNNSKERAVENLQGHTAGIYSDKGKVIRLTAYRVVPG